LKIRNDKKSLRINEGFFVVKFLLLIIGKEYRKASVFVHL
jgi:hypothetical protein